MIGIAWSKSIFEYIDTASKVTNLALGGEVNFRYLSPKWFTIFDTPRNCTNKLLKFHIKPFAKAFNGCVTLGNNWTKLDGVLVDFSRGTELCNLLPAVDGFTSAEEIDGGVR
jgi:hypothetical protein